MWFKSAQWSQFFPQTNARCTEKCAHPLSSEMDCPRRFKFSVCDMLCGKLCRMTVAVAGGGDDCCEKGNWTIYHWPSYKCTQLADHCRALPFGSRVWATGNAFPFPIDVCTSYLFHLSLWWMVMMCDPRWSHPKRISSIVRHPVQRSSSQIFFYNQKRGRAQWSR